MRPELLSEVRMLPPEEKLALIDEIWETLSPEDLPVSSEEMALLDARMAEFEARPLDQSPWAVVKARLEQRRR